MSQPSPSAGSPQSRLTQPVRAGDRQLRGWESSEAARAVLWNRSVHESSKPRARGGSRLYEQNFDKFWGERKRLGELTPECLFSSGFGKQHCELPWLFSSCEVLNVQVDRVVSPLTLPEHLMEKE